MAFVHSKLLFWGQRARNFEKRFMYLKVYKLHRTITESTESPVTEISIGYVYKCTCWVVWCLGFPCLCLKAILLEHSSSHIWAAILYKDNYNRKVAEWRRDSSGIVFQFFQLKGGFMPKTKELLNRVRMFFDLSTQLRS